MFSLKKSMLCQTHYSYGVQRKESFGEVASHQVACEEEMSGWPFCSVLSQAKKTKTRSFRSSQTVFPMRRLPRIQDMKKLRWMIPSNSSLTS